MPRFSETDRLRTRILVRAFIAAIMSLAVLAGAARADVTQVSGGAFGEQVDVTPLGLAHVTSGPLPTVTLPAAGGGPITDSVASVNVPNLLTAGVLNVSTQGGNLNSHQGFATSSASVADVNALSGRVTAVAVASQCRSTGDGSTGSSTLTTAQVLGSTVAANPAPNTVIALPNIGTITLNEQVRPTNGAGDTSIVVRAIHIRFNGILGTGDIIVAESRCGAKGPDVVPVAPIGLIGLAGVLGVGLGVSQWRGRRRRRRHNSVVAAAGA